MSTESSASNDAQDLYKKIDHIALAVRDLEPAIRLFSHVLGFRLVRRRTIRGQATGMVSAEMEHNGIKFVLCQGTEPESQVSKLVTAHGVGVAHIALQVDDIRQAAFALNGRGMEFETSLIEGPGLRQIFSRRDANTGLSFELIERTGEGEFLEDNVQALFSQLERKDAY